MIYSVIDIVSARRERQKRLMEIEVTKKEEKAGQEGSATSMITANIVNGIDVNGI